MPIFKTTLGCWSHCSCCSQEKMPKAPARLSVHRWLTGQLISHCPELAGVVRVSRCHPLGQGQGQVLALGQVGIGMAEDLKKGLS